MQGVDNMTKNIEFNNYYVFGRIPMFHSKDLHTACEYYKQLKNSVSQGEKLNNDTNYFALGFDFYDNNSKLPGSIDVVSNKNGEEYLCKDYLNKNYLGHDDISEVQVYVDRIKKSMNIE